MQNVYTERNKIDRYFLWLQLLLIDWLLWPPLQKYRSNQFMSNLKYTEKNDCYFWFIHPYLNTISLFNVLISDDLPIIHSYNARLTQSQTPTGIQFNAYFSLSFYFENFVCMHWSQFPMHLITFLSNVHRYTCQKKNMQQYG